MIDIGDEFRIAAKYYPSRTGTFWWENFSLSEVTDNFGVISRLGLRCLEVDLTWQDFQPDGDRISVPRMRDLEKLLDTATETGISITLVLFPVTFGSMLLVPQWTLDSGGEAGRSILAGHYLSRRPVRNFFHEPGMAAAALRLVREIIGAFSQHPAAQCWMLGDRLTTASVPDSDSALTEWLGRAVDECRSAGYGGAVECGISARDVIRTGAVSLREIGALGVTMAVAEDWQPSWAEGSGALWPAFVTAYASCLAGRPAVIRELGPCTGQNTQLTAKCMSQAKAADYWERCLQGVQDAGGGGCSAFSLLDFSEDLATTPLFRESRDLLSRGILYGDGTPKDMALVLTSHLQDSPVILRVPADFPAPDPERVERDADAVARESFDAFTQ